MECEPIDWIGNGQCTESMLHTNWVTVQPITRHKQSNAPIRNQLLWLALDRRSRETRGGQNCNMTGPGHNHCKWIDFIYRPQTDLSSCLWSVIIHLVHSSLSTTIKPHSLSAIIQFTFPFIRQPYIYMLALVRHLLMHKRTASWGSFENQNKD